MNITTWRDALELLRAGGLLTEAGAIWMPDGTRHECWLNVRIALQRRGLLVEAPAADGLVLNREVDA